MKKSDKAKITAIFWLASQGFSLVVALNLKSTANYFAVALTGGCLWMLAESKDLRNKFGISAFVLGFANLTMLFFEFAGTVPWLFSLLAILATIGIWMAGTGDIQPSPNNLPS